MALPIVMTMHIDVIEVESYIDERIARMSNIGIGMLLNGQVSEFLSERVSRRFDSGGDAASGTWAPLKPATIAARKARGNAGTQPLIETGTLRAWAEDPPGTLASREGNESVLHFPTIGPKDSITNYKYLAAQFGIDNTFGIGGMKTPPRPIFAVDDIDLSGIMMILMTHALER